MSRHLLRTDHCPPVWNASASARKGRTSDRTPQGGQPSEKVRRHLLHDLGLLHCLHRLLHRSRPYRNGSCHFHRRRLVAYEPPLLAHHAFYRSARNCSTHSCGRARRYRVRGRQGCLESVPRHEVVRTKLTDRSFTNPGMQALRGQRFSVSRNQRFQTIFLKFVVLSYINLYVRLKTRPVDTINESTEKAKTVINDCPVFANVPELTEIPSTPVLHKRLLTEEHTL